MNFKILVDSEAFWASLKTDILSAQEQVYIQTLSFEGDRSLIEDFKRKIFTPDLNQSRKWTGTVSDRQGKWGYFQLKAACQLFLWLNRIFA